MIQLIVGTKGSGKTKTLVDMINAGTRTTSGNVVVIEKGMQLTYDIDYKARLVDMDEYHVAGADMFYGFVAGVLAGNYDITDIFVDSTLKIGGGVDELLGFVEKLKKLSDMANTNVVLSVSADPAEIPAEIAELAKEI